MGAGRSARWRRAREAWSSREADAPAGAFLATLAASPGKSKALLAAARGARIVLVTVPDEAVGRRIARALVEERLAACGNVLPIAASVYRWEGKVVEESEHLLLLKTRSARLAALARRILALHPYEVPEILVLPVERGLVRYLAWVGASASG